MFFVVIMLIQLLVTVIVGMYFFRQMRSQNPAQKGNKGTSRRDYDKLLRMRQIRLSEPLNEQVRPQDLKDIVGQEQGVQALKAILCGPNPQHVLIYGPPGIGKTCAARLVLEEAKASKGTPFAKNAPFIEMDATCVRFDERAIADPLIGSVHDPIYQGAGQLGINGVPQPKEGAVSRAHGGVLFLDEIGELHPIQMNKLLKVLEDRLVRFESAYYNPDDSGTPKYIHEIFQNGMPADFRLVGATTRSPQEISPALRSRCIEVFFRELEMEDLAAIAQGAAQKAGFAMDASLSEMIGRYASSGREAVSIVQLSAGISQMEGRKEIVRADVEWVLDCGHYSARIEPEREHAPETGVVNGLAVHGAHQGSVMKIEALALPGGSGQVTVNGIVETEDLGEGTGHRLRRKSTAKGAAENALVLLRKMGIAVKDVDVHINFPGGIPVDGPSAGVAMAVAVYSAITGIPVRGDVAITGEISVRGLVMPVGGVPAKIQAAIKAGMRRVLVPIANHQARYGELKAEIVPIQTLEEAFEYALGDGFANRERASAARPVSLAATGAKAQRDPAALTNAAE